MRRDVVDRYDPTEGYVMARLEDGDVGLIERLSAPGVPGWTLLISKQFEPLDGFFAQLQTEQDLTGRRFVFLSTRRADGSRFPLEQDVQQGKLDEQSTVMAHTRLLLKGLHTVRHETDFSPQARLRA